MAPSHPAADLAKVPLYKRCEPSAVYFLSNQVSIQSLVPKVVVIARYQFEWVRSVFLLHPGDPSLPRASQIISVGEVEAIAEHGFHSIEHLIKVLVD